LVDFIYLDVRSFRQGSEVFDNPESVYRACADMKLFNQEVLRIVLLDAKRRLISFWDVKHFDEGLGWFGITLPISMQRCQEPFLKDLPRTSFSP